MNTKKTVILIVALLISCTPVKFLPKINEVHTSPFGSYIRVNTLGSKVIKGELIAVSGDTLFISERFPYDTCIVVKDDVKSM